MKKLNLMVNLEGVNLNAEDKAKSPQKLFAEAITNVMLNYSAQKQGIDEVSRRKYYKITDALDAAVKDGKESVDLDDDWMGFLKTCFRESKLMPNVFLSRIEEIVLYKE